jgi:hypothetical protein
LTANTKDLILKYAGTGRPSKLTRDLLKKTVNFFQEFKPWYESPIETQYKNGNTVTTMERKPNSIPTITQLADFLGVARFTLYRWMDDIPEFYDIIKKYKDILTEDTIIENGMLGNYPPAFSIFYLKNKHGYSDKTEDDNEAKKPPNQVFQQQINYFLSQQGLEVHEIKRLTGELPAFEEEVKKADPHQDEDSS